jgi:HEAT repeat protein
MGEAAEPAVPELVQLLVDEDDEVVRACARDSLVQTGRPAALALVEKVEHGTPVERDRALDALERMGPKGKAAVPRLLILVAAEADDLATLRFVKIIWGSDPQALRGAGAAQSKIVRLAAEADVPVASQAVAVLGAFEAGPAVIVPIVVRHPVRVERWMKATGADPAGEWGKAMASVYALHAIGRRAVPTLLDMAGNDHDGLVRTSALQLLQTSKLARASDAPRLVKLLEHEDPLVRRKSADVLGRLGSEARTALPRLRELVSNDPDLQVRESAEAAIRQMERNSKSGATGRS